MSDLFGWDLIYKVTESDLNKKEDVMTLLVHFVLIRNGYRCIGLGDDKTFTGTEASSEILPKGWNTDKNYAIRYGRENELYILRGVPVDDNMVYNLLRVEKLAVSNVAFNTEGTVGAIRGTLDTLIPSSEQVVNKIKNDLLNHQSTEAIKEATTQTAECSTSERIPQPTPYLPPDRGSSINPFWADPDRDPLRVGGRDRDPFGQGGGMLYNPLDPRRGIGIPDPGAGIPGGLPRGSIPPGARFDPFAPPGIGGRPRPPPGSDFRNMFL